MGVKQLWKLIGPVGRNIRLDTLHGTRLAIDSSIWLYQFTQAMRDKEGATLTNAHILGFLRRILKLLFWGIKPVFVFDGNVPELKKRVIAQRRARKEAATTSIERTAKKLIAAEMRRAAMKLAGDRDETESQGHRDHSYLLNAVAAPKERAPDPYFLPSPPKHSKLDQKRVDPRLATEAELKDMIAEMAPADFDVNHPSFVGLSPDIQYEIIGDLRIRSRQTSHKRLTEMLELSANDMDFSKAQVIGVMQRNKLTQKLINIHGESSDPSAGSEAIRIATERGKEYILTKRDEGLGGGFSMAYKRSDESAPIIVHDSSSMHVPSSDPFTGPHDTTDEELEMEIVELNPQLKASASPEKLQSTADRTEALTRLVALNHSKANLSKVGGDALLTHEFEAQQQAIAAAKAKDAELFNSKYVPNSEDGSMSQFEEVEVAAIGAGSPRVTRSSIEDTRAKGDDETFVEMKPAVLFTNVDAQLTNAAEGPRDSCDSREPDQRQESGRSSPSPATPVATHTKLSEKLNHADVKFDKAAVLSWASNYADPQDMLPLDEPRSPLREDSKAFMANSSPVSGIEPEIEESTQVVPQFSILDFAVMDEESSQSPVVPTKQVSPARSECSEETVSWAATPPRETDPALQLPAVELPASDTEDEESPNFQTEQAEYAKFSSTLRNRDFREVEKEIELEISDLRQQKNHAIRQAHEIGQEMIRDIQDLLSFFGIPYITAPMEAEAQCAELARLKLVDGVITDDSDIFLFGGQRVFKNMFNQNQVVQCFTEGDLERELGLDRERLIDIAFLLGSDYTEGLPGFGPITSMEVLSEFGTVKSFAEWWRKVQQGKDTEEESAGRNRQKLKRAHTNLYLDSEFPNPFVRDAYLSPSVDHSEEEFVWGFPDLDALRGFLANALGWNYAKVDQDIVPVIQRQNLAKPKSQPTIDSFYDLSAGLGQRSSTKGMASARLQQVVKSFRKSKSQSLERSDEEAEEGSTSNDIDKTKTVNKKRPQEQAKRGRGPKHRKT